MNGIISYLFSWLPEGWIAPATLITIVRVLLIVVIGFPILKFIAVAIGKKVGKNASPQAAMISKRFVLYLGLGLILVSLLNEFGFKLSALLGALGIFGLAIGFASQTSVSNIISGIFLLAERPFEIGDAIQIGGTVGIVESIDLLSVKLKTFDNRFVRMPNENLIKTEVINITRFPIRRLDLEVGVAYKEDIKRVIQVLKELADKNEYCLKEPAPVVFMNNFGNSSIDISMRLWFDKVNLLNLRGSILLEIKERFDAEGIEIPFPHISIYTGEQTKSFPIKMAEKKD